MTGLQKLFGENVKYYRKKLKLTQAQLSEIIDVSPSFIGFIETGKTCPSFKTIEALASALQITADKLFYKECAQNDDCVYEREVVYDTAALDTGPLYNPGVARVIYDLKQLIIRYSNEVTPPHTRNGSKHLQKPEQ